MNILEYTGIVCVNDLCVAGTYTPEQVSSPELHYRHHSNHDYDEYGDRPSGNIQVHVLFLLIISCMYPQVSLRHHPWSLTQYRVRQSYPNTTDSR